MRIIPWRGLSGLRLPFLVLLLVSIGVPLLGARLPEGFPRAGQEDDPSPLIRVRTNLVSVPVSVRNPSGDQVKDLRLEDFQLKENGRVQRLANLRAPGTQRLELVLLFDLSESSRRNFFFQREAAASFLHRMLRGADVVQIFTIGREPRRVLPRTVDVWRAVNRLKELEPVRETTALFDTVVVASRALNSSSSTESRRVIVAVTDGEDNFSEHGLKEAEVALLQADCVFFSINPSGPSIRLNPISLRGQEYLQRLAEGTGGSTFLPARDDDLEVVFGRIATELEAHYRLEYYPQEAWTDGDFRQIEVDVPSRPDLKVRARSGYFPAFP